MHIAESIDSLTQLLNELKCDSVAVRDALKNDEEDIFRLLRGVSSSSSGEQRVLDLVGYEAQSFLGFLQEVRL
jgi:hypothetical protein